MSATTVLAREVLRKTLTLRVRYAVNTLSTIVMMYVLFLLVFFGGRAFEVQAVTDSLEGILVGIFLFTTAQVAYSRVAFDVTREAQWGTLEQLYMSTVGFGRVMVIKTTVNLLISFAIGVVLLVMMLATTGRSLAIDLLTIVPLGLVTLAAAVGIGFVLGGAALVYKRLENTFNLLQFAFVAFLATPLDAHPVVRFLPLSLGNALLRRAMSQDLRLWELPATDLGLVVVVSGAYVVAGLVVLKLAARTARRRGVLGHY